MKEKRFFKGYANQEEMREEYRKGKEGERRRREKEKKGMELREPGHHHHPRKEERKSSFRKERTDCTRYSFRWMKEGKAKGKTGTEKQVSLSPSSSFSLPMQCSCIKVR